MNKQHSALAGAALAVLALAAVPALADEDTGRKVGGVVKDRRRREDTRYRDGFLTFGRSVRSFFTGGPGAARETWRENAAETRENAREGAAAVRGEANR